MKDSLCWYCSKSCDMHKCSIVAGKLPPCAMQKRGKVVTCTEFLPDVPLPMSKTEILRASGCYKIELFNSRLGELRRKLKNCKTQYSYVICYKKLFKLEFLQKMRKPLDSNWRDYL